RSDARHGMTTELLYDIRTAPSVPQQRRVRARFRHAADKVVTSALSIIDSVRVRVALSTSDGCVSPPCHAGKAGRDRACARHLAGTGRDVSADVDGPHC